MLELQPVPYINERLPLPFTSVTYSLQESGSETGAWGTLTAEEEAELMIHYQYTGATTNIHPLLSAMVNYAQPVKFQGFDVADGKHAYEMFNSFMNTFCSPLYGSNTNCLWSVGGVAQWLGRRSLAGGLSLIAPMDFWPVAIHSTCSLLF